MTPHGFIEDDDKAIKRYKQEHQSEWEAILGGSDFKLVGEEDEIEYSNEIFSKEPE